MLRHTRPIQINDVSLHHRYVVLAPSPDVRNDCVLARENVLARVQVIDCDELKKPVDLIGADASEGSSRRVVRALRCRRRSGLICSEAGHPPVVVEDAVDPVERLGSRHHWVVARLDRLPDPLDGPDEPVAAPRTPVGFTGSGATGTRPPRGRR